MGLVNVTKFGYVLVSVPVVSTEDLLLRQHQHVNFRSERFRATIWPPPHQRFSLHVHPGRFLTIAEQDRTLETHDIIKTYFYVETTFRRKKYVLITSCVSRRVASGRRRCMCNAMPSLLGWHPVLPQIETVSLWVYVYEWSRHFFVLAMTCRFLRLLLIQTSIITLSMMTSSNGNSLHVASPLCGEFIGDLWIPHTKARALMFSLICAWINGWVNNREAGDLRRHCAHYDVIVMCMDVHQ